MTECVRVMQSAGVHRGRHGVRLTVECYGDEDSWDQDRCFELIKQIIEHGRPVLHEMVDTAARTPGEEVGDDG